MQSAIEATEAHISAYKVQEQKRKQHEREANSTAKQASPGSSESSSNHGCGSAERCGDDGAESEDHTQTACGGAVLAAPRNTPATAVWGVWLALQSESRLRILRLVP